MNEAVGDIRSAGPGRERSVRCAVTRGLISRRMMQATWLAVFLAPGSSAHAHLLRVFAEVVDDMIVGQGYFSGGAYPVHLPVHVFGPARQKLAETTNDESGRFSFKPVKRQTYTF